MTRKPPWIRTKYPSSRRRFKSALRFNSSRDIEDRSFLVDLYGATSAELSGVRRGGGVAESHRERDVGVVSARESDLYDLLEGDLRVVHHAWPRVDDDFVGEGRPRRGVEVLDAGRGEID